MQSTKRIATCLTPPGRSAIATIRASGQECNSLFEPFFKPASGKKLSEMPLGRIVFGDWSNLHGTAEELVVVPVSKSELDIHCHGGAVPIEAILESLESIGFENQVSQSGFGLESKTNLDDEIRFGLLHARTAKIAKIFLQLQDGVLKKCIDHLQQKDLTSVLDPLERLHSSFELGQFLIRPIRIVLAGAPNVGKSSIGNSVLGYNRSIVLDQPGTTRDVVSETTTLDGWNFELSDTAGIRATDDSIESAGVELAKEKVQNADILVWIISGDQDRQQWQQQLNDSATESGLGLEKSIQVINKMDRLSQQDHDFILNQRPDLLLTNARTGEGIDVLIQQIKEKAIPSEPVDRPVLFTKRQYRLVSDAIQSIRSDQIAAAKKQLSQIIDESCPH